MVIDFVKKNCLTCETQNQTEPRGREERRDPYENGNGNRNDR